MLRRETARYRTAQALYRLSERQLADIGIARGRIAEAARRAAREAVPISAPPQPGRKGARAGLRAWTRRAAIRELASLDDRLLRDIGIEPTRIGEFVDALLSRDRDIATILPVAHPFDGLRRGGPAPWGAASPKPGPAVAGVTSAVGAAPEAQAMQARAANDSQPPQRRCCEPAGS
jgi:uncharacterized protein YjiS (DUF1127 family)